jgi:hypothetical protein
MKSTTLWFSFHTGCRAIGHDQHPSWSATTRGVRFAYLVVYHCQLFRHFRKETADRIVCTVCSCNTRITLNSLKPNGCYKHHQSLKLNNSTLCPFRVFMRFLCISEQTVIMSVHSINWLVFMIEKEWVKNSSELTLVPVTRTAKRVKTTYKYHISHIDTKRKQEIRSTW